MGVLPSFSVRGLSLHLHGFSLRARTFAGGGVLALQPHLPHLYCGRDNKLRRLVFNLLVPNYRDLR